MESSNVRWSLLSAYLLFYIHLKGIALCLASGTSSSLKVLILVPWPSQCLNLKWTVECMQLSQQSDLSAIANLTPHYHNHQALNCCFPAVALCSSLNQSWLGPRKWGPRHILWRTCNLEATRAPPCPLFPPLLTSLAPKAEKTEKVLVQILVIPERLQCFTSLLSTDHECPQETKDGCVYSKQPGKLLDWESKEENTPQTQCNHRVHGFNVLWWKTSSFGASIDSRWPPNHFATQNTCTQNL